MISSATINMDCPLSRQQYSFCWCPNHKSNANSSPRSMQGAFERATSAVHSPRRDITVHFFLRQATNNGHIPKGIWRRASFAEEEKREKYSWGEKTKAGTNRENESLWREIHHYGWQVEEKASVALWKKRINKKRLHMQPQVTPTLLMFSVLIICSNGRKTGKVLLGRENKSRNKSENESLWQKIHHYGWQVEEKQVVCVVEEQWPRAKFLRF
ncbi:hypothetical protein CDAR_555631 [Caerostris darwini]|uniref:Uncharacterized protein n=1 Tax=Caerostris darwini TaxID=1538125 RepID=A0AAV4QYX6_9ARAC|nr:hypothetical protein CDAR_555631 [Caerostris darwini]